MTLSTSPAALPCAVSAHDLHQHIWMEFRSSACPRLRQELAQIYLDLVQALATQLASGLPACVEVSDLVQEGYFGLHRAIGSFDMSYGVKFTTYATSVIRGAMLDSLRKNAWAPRGARQRAADMDRVRAKLTSRLERPPSDEEMAESFGVSRTEFGRLEEDARLASQISFCKDVHEDGGGASSGSMSGRRELLPADLRAEDPALAAQRQDMRELLLRGFDGAERLIVILYYFERMTMKEIGATLGISESRVSQMHSLIVRRIKASLADRMKEFV